MTEAPGPGAAFQATEYAGRVCGVRAAMAAGRVDAPGSPDPPTAIAIQPAGFPFLRGVTIVYRQRTQAREWMR